MISAVRHTVYKAFGIRLSSSIPLPELPVFSDISDENENADVVIETADPNRLWDELQKCGSNFVRKDNRFLFLIPETAIFSIDDDGSKIAVAPLPNADMEKVRVYLLGTCTGALLMIRKVLPLHGSAVVIGGNAYAFLGDSGAGKSTLAAAFVNMGHQLVSDDVIAVTDADRSGFPVIVPSYPQQKLWQESIHRLGMESGNYRTIYRETTKFAVPVSSRFCYEPVPLAGVFELVKSEGNTVRVSSLPNLDRLRIMLLHTYRNMLIRRLGLEQWHFNLSTEIANRIPVYQLQRPAEGFTAQRLASEIIRTIEEGVTAR
ncbi:phosphoenolpyruvate carboxykinase (ATP) [Paenibacillus alkalitolerans]|uniref:aldolase n=1 Tax=Paenibacillus alkalitolerans TaxID=2799335 RepID=UPI0018F56AF6|nr:aldolase [Paenibacillus alkalitolerans]